MKRQIFLTLNRSFPFLFLFILLCSVFSLKLSVAATKAVGPAKSAWPCRSHDTQHTGRSPYLGAQINTLRWSYKTGSIVHSSPAIGVDGTIYVGSCDKSIYALNPDGSLKWKYQTQGLVGSSPAIGADGTIYVGSRDDRVYALNPNGILKWSYQAGDMVESSPAIGADGTVYVGSHDYKIYAFNPGDGSLKWSYKTGFWVRSSPAIGPDGTIYVGSTDGKLYALTPDGTLKWSYQTGGYVESSPAIGADGTIYVGSCDGIGNDDSMIYALTPDGNLKWSYRTGAWVSATPAIDTDGTIYVGSNNGLVHALNANGALKWSYRTAGGIVSSPAIGADGNIYIGCYDGKIYAFGEGGDSGNNVPNPPGAVSRIIEGSVRVSNLTATSAIISWFTYEESPGVVLYSKQSDVTHPNIAYDVRGAGYRGISHYVKISGLYPVTTYPFQVQSGEAIDNNNGAYYSFTTCRFSLGGPAHTLTGEVFQVDGKTLAKGAIVYITITRDTIQSHPLSYLVGSNLRWEVELRNLKHSADCTDFYWAVGDVIKIDIEGGELGSAHLQKEISGDNPQNCGEIILHPWIEYTLQLKAGYNLICLPLDPLMDHTGQNTSFDSYSLLTSIPGCITITNWAPEAQFYQTAYLYGGEPFGEQFDILTGRSYFVLVEAPVNLTFYGKRVNFPKTLELQCGYNFISTIYGPNMPEDPFTGNTSYTLLHEIPALTITDWDPNTQFYATAYMHEENPCGGLFDILIGRGYIILVDEVKSWTPQAGRTRIRFRDEVIEPIEEHKAPSFDIDPAISDIMVSNISSASATISWFTDMDTPGVVLYSKDPDFAAYRPAHDVRGVKYYGISHYVTISGLDPKTAYYFKIQSGATGDNNGERCHSFTTSEFSMGGPARTLTGRIYQEDGETSAEGAVVYLTISQDEMHSHPLSYLISLIQMPGGRSS